MLKHRTAYSGQTLILAVFILSEHLDYVTYELVSRSEDLTPVERRGGGGVTSTGLGWE